MGCQRTSAAATAAAAAATSASLALLERIRMYDVCCARTQNVVQSIFVAQSEGMSIARDREGGGSCGTGNGQDAEIVEKLHG